MAQGWFKIGMLYGSIEYVPHKYLTRPNIDIGRTLPPLIDIGNESSSQNAYTRSLE
jgi:hypothetical protein